MSISKVHNDAIGQWADMKPSVKHAQYQCTECPRWKAGIVPIGSWRQFVWPRWKFELITILIETISDHEVRPNLSEGLILLVPCDHSGWRFRGICSCCYWLHDNIWWFPEIPVRMCKSHYYWALRIPLCCDFYGCYNQLSPGVDPGKLQGEGHESKCPYLYPKLKT